MPKGEQRNKDQVIASYDFVTRHSIRRTGKYAHVLSRDESFCWT